MRSCSRSSHIVDWHNDNHFYLLAAQLLRGGAAQAPGTLPCGRVPLRGRGVSAAGRGDHLNLTLNSNLTYFCRLRSCYEAARRKRLAPFRAAGFRCAAAAWALPDAELFARQRRQFLEGGAAVPDAAMADMRGPPSAVHTGHCCFV